MLKQILAGTIAALALSSMAGAKDAAPAPPPMPAELAQLDYFVGTWHCSGKTFASPMGPEHATAATVHAERGVGGRWLHIAYDEKKTAANAMPYHAGVYMGYDVGAKKFVSLCFDGFGGECSQTSAGWSGDKLVFEGTAHGDDGKTSGARDTFTKKSAGELIHSGEMQGDDKQWIKMDEENCRKGK